MMQDLVKLLGADQRVAAAYCSRAAGRIDLHICAPAGLAQELGALLGGAHEVAYSGPAPEGWRMITLDGTEWVLHFRAPAASPPQGAEVLFDRRSAPPEPAEGPRVDLPALAGSFWCELYLAAEALRQRHLLTAHGRLEECRQRLVDLYRLALAAEAPGKGWEGADEVPGLAKALAPLNEWLVVPLEARALWRSAHRIAAAFESLVLPLFERLSAEYPMAMRNLAFRRLDEARPEQRERAPEALPAKTSPPRPARMRVAKGRIRRGP